MTKGELMDLVLTEHELRNCDTSIPKHITDVLTDLGVTCFGKYVIIYTDKQPKLVDLHERFFLMYQNANDLLKSSELLMTIIKAKGDCWDPETVNEDKTDEKMKREYFHVNYQIKVMNNNIKDQK